MRIESDGISLHYEAKGSGEPILLVHGFPLSRELWEPIVPQLEDSYRVIAPDLRGHGRSEASAEAGMDRFADDLLALLEHSGERRPVVLVGLSMGGYVCLEFLRRYPDRVRALVLANTRASADSTEQARGRHETAERVLREGSSVVADSMVEKLFAPAAPAELRARWHAIMAATPPQGIAAALRGMAQRPASFDALAAFARPVLIIAGADDAITSLDDAEAMRRAAPDARLETIPGAGHLTPVEQPERFGALLRDFLARLPPLPEPGRG